ncbi:uncharacterized protein LOC108913925 [Anoplophora glabripennis]|uniref:uncharacterized protein LOC108913925 n=1 Tax=Anoplophora glabripennis TaxID=217634 RepID=UPI000875560F|nr:uncharacterized protein LOC108913925 [Anoplophora glabripennis]
MVPCLYKDKDEVKLKKTHNYYYQVQGQLAITGRVICYFVIYTGDSNDLLIQKIASDKPFIDNMFKKLETFYMDCLAPEIILNRRGRNLKCKDPTYILEAKRNKESKKNRNRNF